MNSYSSKSGFIIFRARIIMRGTIPPSLTRDLKLVSLLLLDLNISCSTPKDSLICNGNALCKCHGESEWRGLSLWCLPQPSLWTLVVVLFGYMLEISLASSEQSFLILKVRVFWLQGPWMVEIGGENKSIQILASLGSSDFPF